MKKTILALVMVLGGVFYAGYPPSYLVTREICVPTLAVLALFTTGCAIIFGTLALFFRFFVDETNTIEQLAEYELRGIALVKLIFAGAKTAFIVMLVLWIVLLLFRPWEMPKMYF